MGYNLRAVQDTLNELLHAEGYSARLHRHAEEDRVTFVLYRLVWKSGVSGDLYPVVHGKRVSEMTVSDAQISNPYDPGPELPERIDP